MCFPPTAHEQFKHQVLCAWEKSSKRRSMEHVSAEEHCAGSDSPRCAANAAQVVQDSSGKPAVLHV